MADIYSHRFCHLHGQTTPFVVTVPAGFTAVLRCGDAYNGGSTPTPTFFFEGSVGQTIWYQTGSQVAASYGSWRGRQVFLAGETMTFNPSVGTWDATFSGYLLTNP